MFGDKEVFLVQILVTRIVFLYLENALSNVYKQKVTLLKPLFVTRLRFKMVLGKLADRAFSRQGKNEKFSRQFYYNWSMQVSVVRL